MLSLNIVSVYILHKSITMEQSSLNAFFIFTVRLWLYIFFCLKAIMCNKTDHWLHLGC